MGKPGGLADPQRRALARLKTVRALGGFYLAGGSGIAHHLRHRLSYDLDLFSPSGDVDLDALRQALVEALGDVEVVALSDATLRVRIDSIPVDFVRYPYAPLEPPASGPEGFGVAGLLDLATMKLAAISRRGIRRDFWDLHEILTRTDLTLGACLEAYRRRFGTSESDRYHVLRSLTYFEDAERETVFPAGLTAEHWADVRAFFRQEAPRALGEG